MRRLPFSRAKARDNQEPPRAYSECTPSARNDATGISSESDTERADDVFSPAVASNSSSRLPPSWQQKWQPPSDTMKTERETGDEHGVASQYASQQTSIASAIAKNVWPLDTDATAIAQQESRALPDSTIFARLDAAAEFTASDAFAFALHSDANRRHIKPEPHDEQMASARAFSLRSRPKTCSFRLVPNGVDGDETFFCFSLQNGRLFLLLNR